MFNEEMMNQIITTYNDLFTNLYFYITITGLYLTFFTAKKVHKKYAFSKEQKFKTFTFCKQEANEESTEAIIKKKEFEEQFAKIVNDFRNNLNTTFPDVNKNNFNRNIETLRIYELTFWQKLLKRKGDLFPTPSLGGKYYYSQNIVAAEYMNRVKILFHELLHMSSTLCNTKNKVCYCGFSQLYNGKTIGNGINEGYTELLACRMLGKNHSNSYGMEQKIVSLLEKIVGMESMQKMYFNGDLYSLKATLEQYMDETEVVSFIRNVDFYNFNFDNNHKALDKIFSFLSDCHLIKQKKNNQPFSYNDPFMTELQKPIIIGLKIYKYSPSIIDPTDITKQEIDHRR